MTIIVHCKGVPREDWRVFVRAWDERGSACLTLTSGTVVTHRGWMRVSCARGATTMTCKTTECKVDYRERVLIFSTDTEGYGGGASEGEAEACSGDTWNRSLSVYALVSQG